MREGTIRRLLASYFALVVSSVSFGVQAEGVADSPNSNSTVSVADSSRVAYFPHNVWFKAQYLPLSGAMQLAEYGVESGTGTRIGAAAGFAYRVAESLSIGVGASIHGIRISDGDSDGDPYRYRYRSANSFSMPVLLSFDPHLSESLRLVTTAGLGYEHAWGTDNGMGRDWSGDGLTALAELGVAVRVLPRLEVLGSVGARVGVVNAKKFENWFHYLDPVFTWAVPLEVGIRYSL